jgi:hypothetical protein
MLPWLLQVGLAACKVVPYSGPLQTGCGLSGLRVSDSMVVCSLQARLMSLHLTNCYSS